jgi:hypothetical protein
MSDESIIVKGNGTIFLAGPPLVKAATGEEVTAEELGGAEVHTVQSGVADHYAEDEPEALRMVRNVLENIGPRTLAPASMEEPEPPAHDVDDLLGLIPSDNRTPMMFVKSLLALLMGLDSMNSNPDMERLSSVDLHRFTVTKSVSLQTTAFSFQNPHRKVHISWNCVVNEAYLLCSYRTLLDSWLGRPTKPVV